MYVHSDLWLDQPDAHERIEARRTARTVSVEEAELLHGWVDAGYAKVSLPAVTEAFCNAFDGEIDALWASRPEDLAVSSFFGAKKSFRDYDGPVREHGYRIPDLHSHSERALDLYLDPALFRMVELIFDQPAVAIQSIYFEHGSMQGLHRDPLFVATNPPLNLCAAWIALEDITEDSGPLAYVPGSHRLPWFEYEPGTVECRARVPRERRDEGSAWLARTMQEHGQKAHAFTCNRGEAFVWHAGLVHGGEAIRNNQRTRKSFVVHYSTAADYKSRTADGRSRRRRLADSCTHDRPNHQARRRTRSGKPAPRTDPRSRRFRRLHLTDERTTATVRIATAVQMTFASTSVRESVEEREQNRAVGSQPQL